MRLICVDGCVQVLHTQLVHALRAILRTSVCKCTLICFLVQKVKALAFDIGFFVKVIPDKKMLLQLFGCW